MKFDKSKTAGDIIEEEVLKSIQKKYPQAYTTKHLGKFSDYDIYIPEIEDGIEVKGDYKSAETGNIVVEVEMNGKPSALSITKAKYWVFVEGYRLIWLTPLDIYRFIEPVHYYNRVFFIGKGDDKGKYGYLLPHEELVKYTRNVGIVQMIKEDSPIYFDNFSKRLELMENNKTKEIDRIIQT